MNLTALGVPLTGDIGSNDLIQSVVCVAEVLDEKGFMNLRILTSEPIATWQELGMLRAAVISSEDDLREAWEEGDEEDD